MCFSVLTQPVISQETDQSAEAIATLATTKVRLRKGPMGEQTMRMVLIFGANCRSIMQATKKTLPCDIGGALWS